MLAATKAELAATTAELAAKKEMAPPSLATLTVKREVLAAFMALLPTSP